MKKFPAQKTTHSSLKLGLFLGIVVALILILFGLLWPMIFSHGVLSRFFSPIGYMEKLVEKPKVYITTESDELGVQVTYGDGRNVSITTDDHAWNLNMAGEPCVRISKHLGQRIEDVVKTQSLTDVKSMVWQGWSSYVGAVDDQRVIFSLVNDDTLVVKYDDKVAECAEIFYSIETFDSQWITRTFETTRFQVDYPKTWHVLENSELSLTVQTAQESEFEDSSDLTESEKFRSLGEPFSQLRVVQRDTQGRNFEDIVADDYAGDEIGVSKRVSKRTNRLANRDVTEIRVTSAALPSFTTIYLFEIDPQHFIEVTLKAERYPSSDFFFTDQGGEARKILDSMRVLE